MRSCIGVGISERHDESNSVVSDPHMDWLTDCLGNKERVGRGSLRRPTNETTTPGAWSLDPSLYGN